MPGSKQLTFNHPHHAVRRIDMEVADSESEFDAGTAQLSKGIGLSGRVTDAEGNGLAAIVVSIAFEWEQGVPRTRGGTERAMFSVSMP